MRIGGGENNLERGSGFSFGLGGRVSAGGGLKVARGELPCAEPV